MPICKVRFVCVSEELGGGELGLVRMGGIFVRRAGGGEEGGGVCGKEPEARLFED